MTIISLRDLAARLGVHRNTLNALTKSGRLPAPMRLGHRTVRWNLEEVEEHLAEQTTSEGGPGRTCGRRPSKLRTRRPRRTGAAVG